MAKILLAWEFGSGLGHLTRLLAVGRGLLDDGHELVVAVQNLASARTVVAKTFPQGARASVVQGHVWAPPTDPAARKVPTHSLADVVRLFRFNDTQLLGQATERWARLVGEIKPDLIVADFSPTLMLATRGKLPRVMVGNGYTIPPAGRLLPPMRPWQPHLHPFSRAHEAEMLVAANRVAEVRREPALDHFADMFSGDATFVCTIPAFDPYAAYRAAPQLIPFNVGRIPAGPPLAERPERRVFIYLPSNHPVLPAVLDAARRVEVRGDIYVSGPQAPGLVKAVPPGLTLHAQPLALDELLPGIRLLIHHAGLATAYSALLAGTPQLVLPMNLEHSITSHGLEKYGAAIQRPSATESDAERLAQDMRALLGEDRFAQAAAAAALSVERGAGEDSLQVVLDGCRRFLG